MEKKDIWIGIDVGKNTCVAAVDFPKVGTTFQRRKVVDLPVLEFENTLTGVKKMLRWVDRLTKEYCQNNHLAEESVELHLLMESTGIYSRQLEGVILGTRPTLKPIIENAALIHSYRKSLNLKNETDFLDAKGIAYYGSDRQPEYRPKNPKIYETLAEMCRLRDHLVIQAGSMKNFYESLQTPMLKRLETAAIKVLNKKIEELTREIQKFVEAHDELRHQVEIMVSMPGIAVLSAAIILAEVGPFYDFSNRNQIGAFCGLNPQQKISGVSICHSKLSKAGSSLVRKILFLNSTQAIKHDPYLAEFYNRLISRGKSPKTAKCACMRKMMTILRAMIAADRKYSPELFSVKVQKTA